MKQKTVIFIFIAILFLILRIVIGRLVSVSFLPFADFDDALMIQYSHLKSHFLEQNHLEYFRVMVKEMGFPLFLNLLSKTGIVYTDAISLIWFLSSVSFTALFAYLTQIRQKGILLFVYVFVLFMPVSFCNVLEKVGIVFQETNFIRRHFGNFIQLGLLHEGRRHMAFNVPCRSNCRLPDSQIFS